jgi:methylmalonyl-CoA mutase
MDKNTEKEKLFQGFAPTTTEEWESTIHKDLKGADYEKKLVWITREGLKVRPYYRSNDLKELKYLDIFPASFPFIRGNSKSGNFWYIRQDIKVTDLKRANEKALDILMKGIDSLGFILDENKEYSKEDLDLLLKNIFAEMVEVNFEVGKNAVALMKNHIGMIQKYNRDFQKIHGSLDFDPVGRLVLKGRFYQDQQNDLDACKELIDLTSALPHFSVINIHGNHFHNAGATIVQELAYSLLQGAEYLTKLTEAGLSASQVAPALKFTFAVGSNYFIEMAKVRAARLLWAHIVKAYGISREDIARMNIHAVTSRWNKSIYDPYVNMLRTTTEAMSSIIGGVDSLTLRPFNEFYEEPGDFAERIARNQQLLLKEESYFDKVADPVSGSYYIENLTDSIAHEAWKLFLEIDGHGGFLEALKKGIIQEKIAESVRQRDLDLATRKKVILGVNQYPNFTEKHESKLPGADLEPVDMTEPDAIVQPLKPYRGAMAFEKIRYATDMHAIKNKRPAAFMLTYGNLAMRIARSQFSRNFFGCAGYETIDNYGFKTVEEGVKAAIDSKAEIVVICSSDDEYPAIAPAVFDGLKDHAIVVVAGYPKDSIGELREKGLDHFIHVRSNVLETLTEFQESLGIIKK